MAIEKRGDQFGGKEEEQRAFFDHLQGELECKREAVDLPLPKSLISPTKIKDRAKSTEKDKVRDNQRKRTLQPKVQKS